MENFNQGRLYKPRRGIKCRCKIIDFQEHFEKILHENTINNKERIPLLKFFQQA
jgi:hypothetical protein